MILPISPVLNNVGGVMVSVLASSVVDLGSSRGQGYTKDCFSMLNEQFFSYSMTRTSYILLR
jgi:hypothetical protein